MLCVCRRFAGEVLMRKLSMFSLLFVQATLCCAMTAQKPVVVTSPDKTINAELTAEAGKLMYRVTVDGQPVLAASRLGIRADGVELGESASLGAATRHAVNETWRFFGAHAIAHNSANEATVPVMSHGQTYQAEVHVANDGVAVRLRLPAKAGRKVEADRSAWTLPGDPAMWLENYVPEYENLYRTTSLKQLTSTPLGLPITAKVGQVYVTLSEAALKDYGDLAVVPAGDGTLEGKLVNDPDGWTTSDAVVQPWRVTVVARDLTALVNTTLVQNLNPPPSAELAHAAWVQPGRSSWQWLAIGDPHQDDQEQWVNWTEQLGFEYYLLDEGWEKWDDPWGAVAKVCAYAKRHHVKIWIWTHSKFVQDAAQRQEYFRKAVKAGVVGVKIDFPPPTNRWWSTWYWDTAKDAAAQHLMVDFHGATKPTGMERTWPNALTREGVRGHEYQITRYKRLLTPEHDTILPFTRYVIGPGDYTPTVFEPKELQGNTWAHELAQAILYTSPYLCFGGHPRDYLANPAKDVLTAIPSVWDETRVLPGTEPGKVVAVARRSGKRWFVGAINGGETTDMTLPLNFLGAGSWKATELFDAEGKPDAWDRKEKTVSASGTIALHLTPRGGFVAEITAR